MTEEEIRRAYIEELTEVAPDISPDEIGNEAHIQDDLDLDSMDILNFVTALHERLGIDIPEPDYPRIATLGKAIRYLGQRLA